MNSITHWTKLKTVALAAIATLGLQPAVADDLEVFINPGIVNITPNLIFVLDASASMDQAPDGSSAPPGGSRLDILKQALSDVMNSNLPDVNVGFTYFRGNAAGIRFPAALLDSEASLVDSNIPPGIQVKDVIESMVSSVTTYSITPTVDSLWEVNRYIRGDRPWFGLKTFPTWNTGSNQYTGGDYRAAHPASYTGSRFFVPLANPTGYNTNCYDYDAYTPGASNSCASQQAAGVELSCTMKTNSSPGRTCVIGGTCDSDCGTVCTGGYTYTQPATGCLNDANGNLWVTKYSGSQPRECCSVADASLTECISDINYASSCNGAFVCKESNAQAPFSIDYDKCYYRRDDDWAYTSPITQQCQKTAVVLLSDGSPSRNTIDYGRLYSDGTARTPRYIRQLIADFDPAIPTHDDIVCDDYTGSLGTNHANCAKELIEFWNTQDQVPALLGSTVDTYTIGFGLSGLGAAATWGYLQDLAAAGGGAAFQANDLGALTAAFQTVIANVTSSNQSFAGYATSFDTGTLQTGDKAYLSVFNPKNERAWDGNIKGYFIVDGVIRDVNGAQATAVDPVTNKTVFTVGSRSFWSSGPDGNAPLTGGFLDKLVPATRDIYVITNPADVANVNLSDGSHDLDTGNTNLTAAVMGMPASATATNVSDMITWARSQRIGDPLHSNMTLVKYDPLVGDILYVATNQGYLHAINVTSPTTVGDTSGGNEVFAFMPNQMVGTLQTQMAGNVAGSHIYGLDGPISTIKQDSNGNGRVDGGESAYLYFGMRRGGTSYFAMDISDPNNPKLAWQINAGDPGFSKLGESWSAMHVARILDGGTPRHVLIFGGGYDSAVQDVAGTTRDPSGDGVGMGIYIVDAVTGALLNSIGDNAGALPGPFLVDVPAMKYSIPSDVRAEDTDASGYIDRVYVGDMGGQLWRMDIVEGGNITSAATVNPYIIADLGVNSGGSTDAQSNRRFFYPPSIASTVQNGIGKTSLAIGSGYRAHPLDNTSNDKLFAIFDPNTTVGPPAVTPAALTVADLYNATANVLGTATGAAKTAELGMLYAKGGWMVDLPSDQKVLARARTFRDRIFLTAFETGTTSACDFTGGGNRFYAVKLADATPAIEVDTDNDGVPDTYTRDVPVDDQAAILGPPEFVTHAQPGTPTSPKPFCTSVYAGSKAVLEICDAPETVNWQSLQ